MSEHSDQQGPEKADPKLTWMPLRRWILVVLILAVAYAVSVLLDIQDGMSTREAATRSAVPAVVIIVFLLVFRRRVKRRGAKP